METINGWTLDRDARGFWLVAGTVRQGPFPRTDSARAWARLVSAPARPKLTVVRTPKRQPVDDGE